MILRIFIFIVLSCMTCRPQGYEELQDQLKGVSDRHELHRLKAQAAEAGVQRLEEQRLSKTAEKTLRSQVQAYCADVQLGPMDVWYGESVVTWARLLLLENRWREARLLLLDQAEVLQNIENNLRANRIPVSSVSPVAGCRYVLGETYRIEWEDSRTLEPAVEALKHFYNVYIKYGDGPWGEKAQAEAEAMQALLERAGKQVRIDLGPHKDAFAANKFKLGARLLSEARYADAVEPIITAINYFPETSASVPALRHFGVCQLELGQEAAVLMAAEYCCERFAADTNAPLAVLGLGRRAIDASNEALGERLFHLYLAAFPEHAKRADILSWFAWRAYQAEEWESVPTLFGRLESELRRIGETGDRLEKAVYIQALHPPDPEKLEAFIAAFPASEWVAPALREKAQAQLLGGNFSGAFQTLEKLSADFPDTDTSKKALSGLITAAVDAGEFAVAEQVLMRMLQDERAYGYEVYLSTGEGLLQAEQFELALTAFDAVPLTAGKALAERALFGSASCRFGTGDFEGCFETLERLLAQNPAAGQFYEARLMQARCLVKLGRTEEAVRAYAETAGSDYAVTLEMAGILSDPEARLAAYQRVALLADANEKTNRPLIAQSIVESLPLCMELQKYELALGACDQFEKLFPEHEQLSAVEQFRREAERALAN